MGFSGADDPSRQDGGAARKTAERQRLAAALRANLARRKAQSRDRQAREPAQSGSTAEQNSNETGD